MKTTKRIQQATIDVVLRHGYDKTTMDDIAKAAGVARSTIYTKWKTKEALFAHLLQSESIAFAHRWYALVDADPEGGTFTGIYKNALLAVRDNPFIHALYSQNREVLGSFITEAQFAQLMTDRLLWNMKLMAMMQEAGLIRPDVDVRTLASVAVVFRQGLLMLDQNRTGDQFADYEQILDLFVTMFRQFIDAESDANASEMGKQMLKDYIAQFTQQYNPDGMGE